MADTVTIPRETWIRLVEDSRLLDCLHAAGVDNWGGWDYALEIHEEKYPEDVD